MSSSTRVIAALALLLPIGLLARAEPVGLVSVATRSGLQEVDEDSVDAYIRAGMHTAVALFGYLDEQDTPQRWGADTLIAHPQELLAWIDNVDQAGIT